MIGLVNRHWKVPLQIGKRPSCDCMCGAVDHCDLFQVRQVRENSLPRGFELERLRVSSQFEFIRKTLIRSGVYHGNAGRFVVAVSYVNTFGLVVVTLIVDVAMKVNGRERVKRGSIVDVEFAVTAAHK